MRSKVKIGDPVRPSLQRNCLVCTKWATCRDPAKTGSYACSRFKSDESSGFELQKLFDEVHQIDKAENLEERIKHADESTLEDIIEDVLNSGLPVTPDLRIDDRDIPRPNNFFEWATKEQFIGTDQPPFAKQIQVCTHFLAEACPVCSDYDYYEEIPVDATMDEIQERVVFLKRGVCPKCKYNRSEMIADGDLYDPLELIGVAGQRSGKSATVVLLESYITQHWLLTPALSQMFNILASTPIVSTYTALTFGQARENLWEPLNSILTDSVWFKEYHSFLKQKGYELGEELLTHNDVSIRYRHKNLFMSPASPSKRTMRGRSRRSAYCDELGWFPVGKTKSNTDFERMDGKEVHTALRNSLKTISAAYRRRIKAGYYNTPKPIMGNISSPSQRNDEIMKLYRTYQNSPSTHYCFLKATWDFNPLMTKEDFATDFQTKPVEAARDYACEPPLGLNVWLTDREVVEGIFQGYPNGIKTFNSRLISKSGKPLTAGHYKTVRQSKSQFSGILALDAGYNQNCFAFCIAYPTEIPDVPENQMEEEEPVIKTSVKVHAVGELIPRKEAPISFTALYKRILLPLCDQFNIGAVISDRWQNIKMLQDLEDATGAMYFEHRLSMVDFENYREAIYDEEINLPRPEMAFDETMDIDTEDYPHCFNLKPVSHLLYQHMTVVTSGNTVLKGDSATDDLFRAVVLAYTGLQQPDVLDEITFVEEPVQQESLSAIASFAGSGKAGGRVGGSEMSVVASKGGGIGASRGAGGLSVRGSKR